ncbi:MAG TPA: hemerythrin domain-containing protein [Nocardioidaceae bacterium]|nr:hemerythrin domain-containing protein [Nocardioidaceae bacterium]
MTEHLTMNTVIHAAVRRDLDRFTQALQSFPAGSAERARQLLGAWRNFHKQLDDHHHDEETIFWPALREVGADDSLVGDLGGEHEKMMTELASTDVAMDALVGDPSAEQAQRTLRAFGQLRAAVESHFEHEERDLEPFAASKMGTEPMQRALKQVRKAHPAGEQGVFMAWLQDGADDSDRAALAKTIPAPVLFVFARVVGRSYTRDIASVWN